MALVAMTLVSVPAIAETVHFRSATTPPTPLQQRLARERGETIGQQPGVELSGELYRPAGDGPFPAVVMNAPITRVVALGASNLTRGLETVVSTARTAWGPEVEVLGALGHGRSYGVESRVVIRTLPGILQSGLWDTLSSMPPAATRGLVTDVGNDILYGFPPPTVLEWVEEAVDRLHRITEDIVVTGLPLHTIRNLSAPAFMASEATARSGVFDFLRMARASPPA